ISPFVSALPGDEAERLSSRDCDLQWHLLHRNSASGGNKGNFATNTDLLFERRFYIFQNGDVVHPLNLNFRECIRDRCERDPIRRNVEESLQSGRERYLRFFIDRQRAQFVKNKIRMSRSISQGQISDQLDFG